MSAQTGSQVTIEGGRITSALDISQDGIATFYPGRFLYDTRHIDGRALLVGRFDPFGHNHDRIRLTTTGTIQNHFVYFVHVKTQFRQQDHIGASSHAGIQRNPSSMVSHHLHHHHPLVRTGSRMQAVDRFGRDIDSRIETERYVRSPDVVIDSLRHTDHIQAHRREHTGGFLCPIATDTDEAVQTELLIILSDELRFLTFA